MILDIEQDWHRFREIIKGRIRQDLKKHLVRGEFIGKEGKDFISIPVPQIEIPQFRYATRATGGVGDGNLPVGTPLGGEGGEAGGGAGNAPGEHILEVEVTIDELAEMLGEELHLPRIEPRGKKETITVREKYSGISRAGPEALRHFKRSYKEALKRHLAAGLYDFHQPLVVPIKEDKRYRSWKDRMIPETNAVIFHILDVSGSMGDEQKETVRILSFWIDTWIRKHYRGLHCRYIVHDATAREVDRDVFYRTRESGGTLISSGLRMAESVMARDYPPGEWNIYLFQFSDGDNWSSSDTRECMQILKDSLLPRTNLYCYGQVEGEYGSGPFLGEVQESMRGDEKVVAVRISGKEGIYDTLRAFLGKGR